MQNLLYLCCEFMEKKTILHIIEWGVAIAALVFLVWKLATYEDYALVADKLRAMGWKECAALALALALMPLNMTLEAWRWKTLMNDGMSRKQSSLNEPLTLNEAHRQVYYSKLAGVITPWRLGEYPARAMMQGEWKQTLSMGAVGSATMTAAIVGMGILALAFSPSVMALLGDSYLYSLCAAVLVLAIILYFAPQALKKWAQVNGTLVWTSIAQSVVRLVCWCVQLGLVLYALGAIDGLADEGMSGLVAKTFVYYLLVTITPNVPVVEVGVRGAWAIFLFGTPNAALAGVSLWVINTLLPCLIGVFMRKKE